MVSILWAFQRLSLLLLIVETVRETVALIPRRLWLRFDWPIKQIIYVVWLDEIGYFAQTSVTRSVLCDVTVWPRRHIYDSKFLILVCVGRGNNRASLTISPLIHWMTYVWWWLTSHHRFCCLFTLPDPTWSLGFKSHSFGSPNHPVGFCTPLWISQSVINVIYLF